LRFSEISASSFFRALDGVLADDAPFPTLIYYKLAAREYLTAFASQCDHYLHDARLKRLNLARKQDLPPRRQGANSSHVNVEFLR